MNLQINGHHIEITPAIRDYMQSKLVPVVRHFDKVLGIDVILSVEKIKQKARYFGYCWGYSWGVQCVVAVVN